MNEEEKKPSQRREELLLCLQELDAQLQAGSLTGPRYRFQADLAHQELEWLEETYELPGPLGSFSDDEL